MSRIQEETNRWRQIRAMMVNREGRGAEGRRGGGAEGGRANCCGGASRKKWGEKLEGDGDGPWKMWVNVDTRRKNTFKRVCFGEVRKTTG